MYRMPVLAVAVPVSGHFWQIRPSMAPVAKFLARFQLSRSARRLLTAKTNQLSDWSLTV